MLDNVKTRVINDLLITVGTEIEDQLISAEKLEQTSVGSLQTVKDVTSAFLSIITDLRAKSEKTGVEPTFDDLTNGFNNHLLLLKDRGNNLVLVNKGMVAAFKAVVDNLQSKIDANNSKQASDNIGKHPNDKQESKEESKKRRQLKEGKSDKV